MSEKPPKEPMSGDSLPAEGEEALSRLQQAYGFADGQADTTLDVPDSKSSTQILVDSVSDITDGRFRVDASGKLRIAQGRTSLGKGAGGQYVSQRELETIAANADLIRDGLKDRAVPSNDAPGVEPAPTETEPVRLSQEELSSIVAGDRVTSTKSSSDGYYVSGASYTVQQVRRNNTTGKYEFHVTNIDTKEDGPTKAYLLSEDDISGFSHGDAPKPVEADDTIAPVELDGDSGRQAIAGDAEEALRARAAESNGALQVDRTSPETGQGEPTGAVVETPAVPLGQEDGNDSQPSDGSETQGPRSRADILQSIIDENNAALNDALTPEQRQVLQAIIEENNKALAETGTDDGQAEAAASARAERNRVITAELDDTNIGRRLKNALGEYASRKADAETKGIDGKYPWHWGRRKREEALKAAEEALFEAQNEYTTALVERRKAAGIYEGEADVLGQAMSDDFFKEFRMLDSNARRAALQMRNDRIERRNPLQKAVAAVGRFLNGGKGKGWLRNGGVGFGAGFGLGLSGVTFPVTAIAGIASGAAIYGASRVDTLDKTLSGYDTKGMSEDEYGNYVRGTAASGADRDVRAKRLADEFFGRARTEGNEKLSAARKKARGNMSKYGLGFAAGGVAGYGMHALLNQDPAAAASQSGNGTKQLDFPNHDGADYGSGPAQTPHTFEFPPDASTITNGEGWYHQFADMGLNADQARSLFSDHTLMDKLVEQGAAYVDNSARIGGYGINMPAGGHLPAVVMDTIKSAIIAKGF